MSTNFYLTKRSNSFTKLYAYSAADVIHESLGHVPSCLFLTAILTAMNICNKERRQNTASSRHALSNPPPDDREMIVQAEFEDRSVFLDEFSMFWQCCF